MPDFEGAPQAAAIGFVVGGQQRKRGRLRFRFFAGRAIGGPSGTRVLIIMQRDSLASVPEVDHHRVMFERRDGQHGIGRPGGQQSRDPLEAGDRAFAPVVLHQAVVRARQRNQPAGKLNLTDPARLAIGIIKGRVEKRAARRFEIKLGPFVGGRGRVADLALAAGCAGLPLTTGAANTTVEMQSTANTTTVNTTNIWRITNTRRAGGGHRFEENWSPGFRASWSWSAFVCSLHQRRLVEIRVLFLFFNNLATD